MCTSNSIRKKNPLKECWTEERCYITELLNDPQSPNISVALARVEINTTTQLHSLRGVQETYVIKKGLGLLEIDDEQISVKENDTILIEANRSQRITNVGNCDLEFYCICIPRFYADCYINLEN